MIRELIERNRTCRRFFQDEKIEQIVLDGLVDLARISSSAGNKQPLKYMIINESEKNEAVFRHLVWAATLKDWDGPVEGEKPAAYIIMLLDKDISTNCLWDHGLAAQNIMLGACEAGLGGCMFNSVNRAELKKTLNITGKYDVLMVMALGKPKEEVVLEKLPQSGDISYWRDEKQVHHVPKRKLEDIILKF